MHAPESGGIHAENQFQLFAPLFNHGILYNRINWTRFHGPCRRGAANIPLSRTEKRDHHRPPIICRTKGERNKKKKRVRNGRIFTDSGLKLGILLIGWTSADPSIFPTPRNQRGTPTTFRKFDEYARNLAAFERGTERIILNYSLFFFFFILIISTIFKSVRKLNHSKTSPWRRDRSILFSRSKKSHTTKVTSRGAWNALAPPFYIHPPRSRVGARVWKQNAMHGILVCRCVNSLEDCGVRIVHRSSGTIPCRTRRNREKLCLTEAELRENGIYIYI